MTVKVRVQRSWTNPVLLPELELEANSKTAPMDLTFSVFASLLTASCLKLIWWITACQGTLTRIKCLKLETFDHDWCVGMWGRYLSDSFLKLFLWALCQMDSWNIDEELKKLFSTYLKILNLKFSSPRSLSLYLKSSWVAHFPSCTPSTLCVADLLWLIYKPRTSYYWGCSLLYRQ